MLPTAHNVVSHVIAMLVAYSSYKVSQRLSNRMPERFSLQFSEIVWMEWAGIDAVKITLAPSFSA